MIDTDKYEGHSIEYSYEIVSVDDDKDMDATYALLNDAPLLLEEVKRLRKGAKWLRKEVKRLREQYTELREALVGDSPNWTHEELIEKALERERHVAFMQWMIEHYDEIVNEWEASE